MSKESEASYGEGGDKRFRQDCDAGETDDLVWMSSWAVGEDRAERLSL